MNIFVLAELPRRWGRAVVQMVGEGLSAHVELRAITHEGKTTGVTVTGAELDRVIAAFSTARDILNGRPEHKQ